MSGSSSGPSRGLREQRSRHGDEPQRAERVRGEIAKRTGDGAEQRAERMPAPQPTSETFSVVANASHNAAIQYGAALATMAPPRYSMSPAAAEHGIPGGAERGHGQHARELARGARRREGMPTHERERGGRTEPRPVRCRASHRAEPSRLKPQRVDNEP